MARSDCIVEEDVSEPDEVNRDAVSESNVADQSGLKVPVRIKYEAFYELPPKRSKKHCFLCWPYDCSQVHVVQLLSKDFFQKPVSF